MEWFWSRAERLFFHRTSGIFAFVALVILLFFTGYQLVPGRQWLAVAWPVGAYYGVVAVGGAGAGFLGGRRRFLAAVSAGLCAVCALWLIHIVQQNQPLERPGKGWAAIGVLALAAGFVPGMLLYELGDWLLSGRRARDSEKPARAPAKEFGRPCVQCGATGNCYCIRKGSGVSRGCGRCGGSGKCHVCQGSGSS